MEGIIQRYTEGEAPEDVIEIELEGWTSDSISPDEKLILEKYSSVDSLSFSGCGLKNLENFPALENLARLDLTNNQISKGLHHLKHLEGIMQIDLENNKIADLEEFKHLAGLESLMSIMVQGNPVAQDENYRQKLFSIIPSLQVVDGFDSKGEEVDFGSEEDFEGDDSEEYSGEEFDDDDDLSGQSDEESESEDPKLRKKTTDQKGKKK
jgi:Leucine-rich repeat (LRR) protein